MAMTTEKKTQVVNDVGVRDASGALVRLASGLPLGILRQSKKINQPRSAWD